MLREIFITAGMFLLRYPVTLAVAFWSTVVLILLT